MNWTAQKQRGVTPAQIEVIWKHTPDHWIVVAERVCPTFPGCPVEPMRAEIAAIVESAPQMLAVIKQIIIGASADDLRKHAERIIEQIDRTTNSL